MEIKVESIEIIPKNIPAINEALKPLSTTIWNYEKIEAEFIPELKEKLKDIPEQRIITPDLTVAGPAIEAIRFVGHKPELRELYANLLASSMDSEAATKAHPAFTDIIKQITPDEAKLIKYFSNNPRLPIINIMAEEINTQASITLVRHYSNLGKHAGCTFVENTPNYLDNLSRLELIKILDDSTYTAVGAYSDLENDPFVLDYLNSPIENIPNFNKVISKGLIELTDFGKQFIEACI